MSVHCLIVTKNRPISCWVFNLSHSEIRQQTTPTTVSTRESTKLWGHEDTHKHDLHIYTYIALAATYLVLSCIHCRAYIVVHTFCQSCQMRDLDIVPFQHHAKCMDETPCVAKTGQTGVDRCQVPGSQIQHTTMLGRQCSAYTWTFQVIWNMDKLFAVPTLTCQGVCIIKKSLYQKERLCIKKSFYQKDIFQKKNCICPACEILHSICCRLM